MKVFLEGNEKLDWLKWYDVVLIKYQFLQNIHPNIQNLFE